MVTVKHSGSLVTISDQLVCAKNSTNNVYSAGGLVLLQVNAIFDHHHGESGEQEDRGDQGEQRRTGENRKNKRTRRGGRENREDRKNNEE